MTPTPPDERGQDQVPRGLAAGHVAGTETVGVERMPEPCLRPAGGARPQARRGLDTATGRSEPLMNEARQLQHRD